MEIRYHITKNLQLLLASENCDAGSERTDILDNEEVADIVLSHDRVHITTKGDVSMDLTWKAACIRERTAFVDRGNGHASGYLGYPVNYIRDKSVRSSESMPEFGFLIDSKVKLKKALAIIRDAEWSALAEVKRLNELELAELPARIKEYNERKDTEIRDNADNKIKSLQRQNDQLFKTIARLEGELRKFQPENDERANDDDYEQAFED